MRQDAFPVLFQRSLGKPYGEWRAEGDGLYVKKSQLIRAYAKYLLEAGERVTHEAIKDMLSATRRGYSLNSQEISLALRGGPFGNWQGMEDARKSNGRRVFVNRKRYFSIRDAAEGEQVAPETVRNRVASKSEKWIGWRYAD